ncbi:MAG: hypothetical protein Q8O88_04045 [bacterium]|nr:hypothetical protein [bacterium]
MATKSIKEKNSITETQVVFNKLMLAISNTLAPRLLGLMKEFGYDSFNVVSDGRSVSIYAKELLDLIEPDTSFWKRRYAEYNTSEKNLTKHTDLLQLFRKFKIGTEHLMKIRNQTDSAIDWIDKIGTVNTRKILIEKFIKTAKSVKSKK